MDKAQQVAQLRLAADLLETGHPWETSRTGDRWWSATPSDNPAIHIVNNQHIRPILATPPDGRPLRNEDELTAEQVGAGYRLTIKEDVFSDAAEVWNSARKEWRKTSTKSFDSVYTYRLPLSVPWPEALAFQLPPPPPGMRWHRTDGWEEDDLPQGWRPLVVGEKEHDEDEFCSKLDNDWMSTPDGGRVVRTSYKVRTRRPLTFTHEGKTWTYHRPGDPMPCDGEARIHVLIQDDLADDPSVNAKAVEWDWAGAGDVIGWRYADEKKTVPLGPEDVPPCSAVNGPSDSVNEYAIVCGVGNHGIFLSDGRVANFNHLKSHGWKINRSLPLTGRWNPDSWEPCSKPA